MTETLRQQLLTACAFAKVFMQAADRELRGAPSDDREHCAEQLAAALRNIEHADSLTATFHRGQSVGKSYLNPQDLAELSRVRSVREAFDKERAGWEPYESL